MVTEFAEHEPSLFALGTVPQGPLFYAAGQDRKKETRYAPIGHVLPQAPWL